MSDKNTTSIPERLQSLRDVMHQEQLSAWIVPSSDAHSSEYVCDHWQGRRWVSGFTGSAGTAVILADKAGLWTDGRYFIQAEEELEGSGMKLFKMGTPNAISIEDWIYDNVQENSCIGFDGKVVSTAFFEKFNKKFQKKNIEIKTGSDLLTEVWSDRPNMPNQKIYDYSIEYAGQSREEKLKKVREEMKAHSATHYLITTLDDIAWLYNYRGDDIPKCPVALAHTIVTLDEAILFIETSKVPESLKGELKNAGIEVNHYNDIDGALKKLSDGSKMIYDANTANSHFISLLKPEVEQYELKSITGTLKTIKNPVEQEHLKNCHIKDGVAMVKFFVELEQLVPKGGVTEIFAADIAEKYRRQIDTFKDLSFTTIPGYGSNGAMMHYSASEDKPFEVGCDNFFLVDSGGQYLDGTTDITRTHNFGELNDEQKKDYTLVLKGHVNLAKAKFMKGTRGVQLDMLARQPLWEHGINYACGTGHGVGQFLNVHEGPQNISVRFLDEEMLCGMNITNEPGIYRQGKWGIRIENIYFVVPSEKNEFGEFMKFEAVTMCPINLKPVLVSMLTQSEKDWLNEYHEEVYQKLSPHLNENEQQWLMKNTQPI